MLKIEREINTIKMKEETKYYIAGSLVGLIPQKDIVSYTGYIIRYTNNIADKTTIERIVKGILIKELDESYYSQAVRVSKDIAQYIVNNKELRK